MENDKPLELNEAVPGAHPQVSRVMAVEVTKKNEKPPPIAT
jgi:hypothetical protein